MITVHHTWTSTGTACIHRRCLLFIRRTSARIRRLDTRERVGDVGAGKEREEGRAPKGRHIGNASRHPRFGFGACALLRADGARPPTLALHVLHVCLNAVLLLFERLFHELAAYRLRSRLSQGLRRSAVQNLPSRICGWFYRKSWRTYPPSAVQEPSADILATIAVSLYC